MVGADVLALPTRDRQDCHPGSQRATPAVEMVAVRGVITLGPPAAFRSKLVELLSCGGAEHYRTLLHTVSAIEDFLFGLPAPQTAGVRLLPPLAPSLVVVVE